MLFLLKKMLGPKKFWLKNIHVEKNFSKKFLGQKELGTKKVVVQKNVVKKIKVQKFLVIRSGSKNLS